jgi:ABC-type sugar transport systems, ATPase components
MSSIIENVKIKKLFGIINYDINIIDNRLVIVGENGSGKSTVVSMIYLFLTKQWKKLKEYEFSEMEIRINGKTLTLSKKELMLSPRSRASAAYYVAERLKLCNLTPEYVLAHLSQELFSKIIGHERRMPVSQFRHILEDLNQQELHLFDEGSNNLTEIESMLDVRILYLPTYRRIERDFKAIFPALEEDIDRYNKRSGRYDTEKKHIELVEFGMEDVSALISNKMNYLNNSFRNSLYSLTGGYLRVVLRKEYKKADVNLLKKIDIKALDGILSRIDESILSEEDRNTLKKTISSLQIKKTSNDIDLISAHIITKLILLHEEQYEREKAVRTFANVCNKYLRNKGFYFDSNHFTLPIRPVLTYGDNLRVVHRYNEIMLSMLSSGEKQIVSLFAHLYLSDYSDHFIIIDEPELSLSVPWQSTFLPDIMKTDRCNGLIAVTHSPFIYENDFSDKTHSIQEFIYE